MNDSPRHYIVQSDTQIDYPAIDLGLITIEVVDGLKRKHWITLPDGTVRKMYNARRVDNTEMDLHDAFGTMPRLNVSYRPMTAFIREHGGWFVLAMIVILVIDVVIGYCFMLAHWNGLVNEFLSHPYLHYVFIFLLIMTPLSLTIIPAAQIADNRWDHLTKADLAQNEKEELERANRQAILSAPNIDHL